MTDHPKETMRFSRRMTMTGAAIAAALGIAAMFGQRRTAEDAILAALSDLPAASQIGQMASWPHKAGREELVAQLLNDLGLNPIAAARLGVPEIRERIARRIGADFAAGRTVRCEGWLLSVTEARLCALAAHHA